MLPVRVLKDGWIIVGDGRKALFLRNDGNVLHPKLVVFDTLAASENLATAAQGADRPGRMFNSADGRRSAVEQTDWHRLAEIQFGREVAAAIDQRCASKNVEWLALVAPPQTLAEWRGHLGAAALGAVKAEVAKELTRRPRSEIERLLMGA
jgi:protein required for attachment to host cells